MAQQFATPGVFIQEVTGPGVIAGVGTSTAAFIGPALGGPINEARLITSYDDFLRDYAITLPDGSRSPFITDPRPFYMAHAVRGFFDNGGRFAYVVRVGTAARAFLDLPDRSQTEGAGFALRVEALEEGIAGNNIQVQVNDASLASSLPASRPTATVTDAGGRRIVVDDAANFRPGDIITIDGTTERQTIDRIDPNTNEIFLTGDLARHLYQWHSAYCRPPAWSAHLSPGQHHRIVPGQCGHHQQEWHLRACDDHRGAGRVRVPGKGIDECVPYDRRSGDRHVS